MRHTARHVASTCCAAQGGGGVPTWVGGSWGYLPWMGVPALDGGTYPGWGRGYLPWMGEGVPTLGRYLPCWLEGRYPPPSQLEGRYHPPPIDWKVGTPPPPPPNRHTPVKTISLRTTYAGGKYFRIYVRGWQLHSQTRTIE